MSEGIGCLFVLIILFAGAIIGAMLFMSKAVLYYESPYPGTSIYPSGYICSYFTGTRTVTLYGPSPNGCKRFINVGG